MIEGADAEVLADDRRRLHRTRGAGGHDQVWGDTQAGHGLRRCQSVGPPAVGEFT
ncbi:MAG: hypothetical protein R2839_04880 [Thermomicrobiales bacterium]